MASGVSESIRQILQKAGDVSKDETVVFRLKGEDGAATPGPADTTRIAHSLMERVRAIHGREPKKLNIFENLGSFVVQGDPALLLHLLDQPEVAAATLNRRPEVEQLRPVRKGPATSKGWVEISN
jgi:hypothetical protein